MLSEANKAKELRASDELIVPRGRLVVVSSPSGGGKGTLIRRVLNEVPNLGYSVSYTTRQARLGEVNGRDYFFVTPEIFKRMVRAGEFLEWANVHEHLYGTAHAQVERELAEGRDIILEIDVQGAQSVRSLVSDSISVFILPPSFEVLSARLTARGSERPQDLALRLRNARGEVLHYREFEYVVINDDADRAARQLAAIIYAERARRERQEHLARRVLATFQDDTE
ncbi:MAG TPA: guanylate kinase [Pyrinomonadaceae bacterium]|nr:guanylate kinase [Pyrinomonadaceae bacterium]